MTDALTDNPATNTPQTQLLAHLRAEDNAFAGIQEWLYPKGEESLERWAATLSSEVARLTGAESVTLYILKEDTNGGWLEVLGGHALHDHMQRRTDVGEGLVGQCAKMGQPIRLELSDARVFTISGSLYRLHATEVALLPLLGSNGIVTGVLELLFTTAAYSEMVEMLVPRIGIALGEARYRMEREHIHQETLEQRQRLEVQEEELRAFLEQAVQSEEELRAKQEELNAALQEVMAEKKRSELLNDKMRRMAAEFSKKANAREAELLKEIEQLRALIPTT